jgi:group I intron endonuclease
MIYIYAYQNKINGKIYIGQTIDLFERDRAHIYGNKSMPIDRAIKKYGRNTFDFWTIDVVNSQEDADHYEIYFIEKMRNEFGKENVYNITNGGSKSPTTGRKLSKETREKISLARQGQKPSLGMKHTVQTKKKISKANKGKKRSNYKSKLNNDQKETIVSLYKDGKVLVKDLARIYKVDRKTIYTVVQKFTKI